MQMDISRETAGADTSEKGSVRHNALDVDYPQVYDSGKGKEHQNPKKAVGCPAEEEGQHEVQDHGVSRYGEVSSANAEEGRRAVYASEYLKSHVRGCLGEKGDTNDLKKYHGDEKTAAMLEKRVG